MLHRASIAPQLWRRFGGNVLILSNQGLNSAIQFIITFFLIRVLGLEGFGEFSLYYLITLNVMAAINALVTQPLVSIASGEPPSIFGQLMIVASLLIVGILVAFGLVMAAAGMLFLELGRTVMIDFLVLGAMVFGFVSAEFARRLCFLSGAVTTAWLLDISRFAVLATTFGYLFFSPDRDDAKGYVLALAGAYFFPALVLGLSALPKLVEGMRRGLDFNRHRQRLIWNGRWLSCAAVLQFANEHFFIFVGSAIAGLEAIGIIRAAQSILGLVNPALYALEHIVPKRLGQTASTQTKHAALADYRGLAVAVFTSFAFLLSVIAIGAAPLLGLLGIPNPENQAWILQVLCLNYSLLIAQTLATFAFRLLERAHFVFYALGGAALISVLIAVPLVSLFGTAGIVGGMVLAGVTTVMLLSLFLKRFMSVFA